MEGKPTMLYVDDEAFNLTIFRLNFKSDFDVLVASSGSEALEILDQQRSVSCIISDMKMPQMDGLEFIRQAKDRDMKVPCFILTGVNFSEELENAKEENMIEDFFSKPFDTDEIRKSVMAHLS